MFYYGISAVLILGILVVVVLYKYFKDVNNYEHDVDFIYNNNEIHREK